MPAAKTLKRYGSDHRGLRPVCPGLQLVLRAQPHHRGRLHRRCPDHQSTSCPCCRWVPSALVLNIPLFILGWQKIGRELLVSSLYATAVSSLMIDVLAADPHLPAHGPHSGLYLRRHR